jgi:hypothetical protein
MTETLTRSYADFEDARNVVQRLEAAGVPATAISLIGRRTTGDDHAVEGASVGGVAGGATGLLAGLGLVAIPGLGPVVAVGWLAAALVGAGGGALVGGLVGALGEAGNARADAEIHADAVRRGGAIVSVRTDKEQATAVSAIMDAPSAGH